MMQQRLKASAAADCSHDAADSKNPANTERIFPYIGGEEVNTIPTYAPSICDRFCDFPLERAADSEPWRRMNNKQQASVSQGDRPCTTIPTLLPPIGRNCLRLFAHVKPAARQLMRTAVVAISRTTSRTLSRDCTTYRVLSAFRASPHLTTFDFLANDRISTAHVVCSHCPSWLPLLSLQSRVHEIWARYFRLNSRRSTCAIRRPTAFETFPFPHGFEVHATLEAAGRGLSRSSRCSSWSTATRA